MSIYRQKLMNAVLFFIKETKHVNLTKLMKLLNFFEFEHFSKNGYPSIGLKYYAFENGPVPKQFWLEVKDGQPPVELKDKMAIIVNSEKNGWKEVLFKIRPKTEVDFSVFSANEKKILERLAFIYKDATATEMSNISHEENMPWEITKKSKGLYAEIDYLLAITEDSQIDRGIAEENLNDHFAFLKAFDVEAVNLQPHLGHIRLHKINN